MYTELLKQKRWLKEELVIHLCYFSGSLSRVKQHGWLGKRSQYSFYWPDPAFKALNGHIIGRWKLVPGILTPTSVFGLWSLISMWLSRSVNFSGPTFLHMWGGAGGGKERYSICLAGLVKIKGISYVKVYKPADNQSVLNCPPSSSFPTDPRREMAWYLTPTKLLGCKMLGQKPGEFSLWLTCIQKIHLFSKNQRSSSSQILVVPCTSYLKTITHTAILWRTLKVKRNLLKISFGGKI